jgi:hypothetical protein
MALLERPSFASTREACFVALLVVACLGAQSMPIVEDDVKAAFLYNFAKYVAWPETAFSAGAFHVCVVADVTFVKRVDEIVLGETIEGHPVIRQTPSTAEDARGCNILFVASGDAGHADAWLAMVRGAHVLTVGDAPDFLARGGVVEFVREGNRVRFDVNIGEAQRAGLVVSSRLLRVARHVSPSGPGQ